MELLLRVRNAERIVSLEVAGVTIFCLAKLAESKDSETGQHLERIRGYSKLLAEQLMKDEKISRQLPVSFTNLIHQTSPLHDIGKVGIPDSILLKPGSLNDAEWAIMKRHAEIGAETLDAALRTHPGAEVLRIARDIAWAHHERWDGSGYPRGLKGDEIPWAARIVALADVYDALTTRRVYKAAMPHDVARGIILQGTGAHFDPRVVQAFLAVEPEFMALQQSLAEPCLARETTLAPQAALAVGTHP
jgi:putative two-component system response regulator